MGTWGNLSLLWGLCTSFGSSGVGCNGKASTRGGASSKLHALIFHVCGIRELANEPDKYVVR